MPESRSTKTPSKPAKSPLDHHLFQRGDLYWIKYYVEGVERRLSLQTSHVGKARVNRDRILRSAEIERLEAKVERVPIYLWEHAVDVWLAHLENQVQTRTLAPKTAKRYAGSVVKISLFLKKTPIDAIDVTVVTAFVEAEINRSRTVRTIGNDLTAWSKVHIYAMQRGMVKANPALAFDRKGFFGTGEEPLNPPTDDEVQALVDEIGAWKPEMAKLVVWLRETGMRLSEALLLRAEDLHPGGGSATLRYGVKGNKRGTKTRTILLGRATALLVGMPTAGRLFSGLHTDADVVSTRYGQWRRQRQDRENRAADTAGRPVQILRTFRLHDLRHAYAIASIIDDDTCAYRLRDHLGHANLSTTERYTSYLRGEGAQRKYVRRVDLFGSLGAPSRRGNRRLKAVA